MTKPTLFKDLQNIQNQMDTMMQELMETPLNKLQNAFRSPRTNITETEKNIKITTELPGANKEDIEIKTRDSTVTIQTQTKNIENKTQRTQRSYKTQLSLPKPVQAQEGKATYKNGVLEITLPKKRACQRRNNPNTMIPLKNNKFQIIQNTENTTKILLDYQNVNAKDYILLNHDRKLQVLSADTTEINQVFNLKRKPTDITQTYRNGYLEVTLQWN